MEGNKGNDRNDEVYSKSVRAGKRTYFFDVKTTKGNDLYLTITESKKKTNHDGRSFYEKHKIYLYKEDFMKFSEGFNGTIEEIKKLWESGKYESYDLSDEQEYSEVDFEDLK